VVLQVKEELADVRFVTYTTDLWTSIANRAYIGLTLHWISRDWKMKSMCCGIGRITGRHTAELLAPWIKSKLEEFGVWKAAWCGVSDGGGNIVNAIKDELKHCHQFCTCHLTNNVVKNAIEVTVIVNALSRDQYLLHSLCLVCILYVSLVKLHSYMPFGA
jgi:hypothetical protein